MGSADTDTDKSVQPYLQCITLGISIVHVLVFTFERFVAGVEVAPTDLYAGCGEDLLVIRYVFYI